MSALKEQFLNGEIILIDKPLGWTSFQVVNKIRWLIRSTYGIKKIKVGHAGTLDPLASGLLILCTGKMTKSIEQFMGQEKEYTGTFTLGATTPSYDLETEIDHTFPTDHITEELLQTTLDHEIPFVFPVIVVHYFMAISTLVGGIGTLFYWTAPRSLTHWLLFFLLGIFGYYGQLFMTKAFQFGQAYMVAPFKYVEVIFTLSLGVFYFEEVYTFWNLLGTALVIISLSLNVIYKSRKG